MAFFFQCLPPPFIGLQSVPIKRTPREFNKMFYMDPSCIPDCSIVDSCPPARLFHFLWCPSLLLYMCPHPCRPSTALLYYFCCSCFSIALLLTQSVCLQNIHYYPSLVVGGNRLYTLAGAPRLGGHTTYGIKIIDRPTPAAVAPLGRGSDNNRPDFVCGYYILIYDMCVSPLNGSLLAGQPASLPLPLLFGHCHQYKVH